MTDIEGTTSSLSFVKDVLFPYARAHLPAFVAAHAQTPAVAALLDDARTHAGAPLTTAELTAQLLRWIDEDRKITPLKTLQGLIWEHGYRERELVGHVYEDAVRNLRHWHAGGVPLYVYSSGSIHAQKLLFGHTDYGDLTPLFSDYFDTGIGHKREADSYRHIVRALALPAAHIAFLSDITGELDAARTAGMQTVWLVRAPGANDADAVGVPHRTARDFDDVNAALFG